MTESRCQQIEKILRQKLRSMQSGEKIPTEMELCAEFSVSRMTMNKVIGKLVDDDLLFRIKKKGTFVKDKRTADRPIYFLLPVVDFLTYDVTRSIRQTLCGLNTEASLSDRKIETLPVTRTNRFNDYDWDALAGISPGSQVFISGFWYKKLFPFLKEKNCEVVCLDSNIWLEKEYRKILSSWYTIKLERKAGAEKVVEYLTKSGRKNPVLFYEYEEKEHPVTEGFKSGLEKSGFSISSERCVHVSDSNAFLSSLKQVYKNVGFDSVVVASAKMVRRTCEDIESLGLKIPDDISVVSLEDAPLLRDLRIPVTAMASPFYEAGREAARMFQRDIFLPGETRLHQLLIERESTRKGAGSAIADDLIPETNIPEALLRFGTDGI